MYIWSLSVGIIFMGLGGAKWCGVAKRGVAISMGGVDPSQDTT